MYNVFTPYRVCPLGAHVDHQNGLVTGFAIDRGVSFDFEVDYNGEISVKSENFSGFVKFSVYDIPEREMNWGDFIKGAVVTLKRKYNLKCGLHGVIEGTLPVGGLSSSAAVIITYINALCIVNDIALTQQELIQLAIWEERNYIDVKVGKLDQSCEVYCKKNHLLFLDTKEDSCELIPINSKMPNFEIMIVFCGLERKLAGSAYNMRVDECKAASYALKALSGMDYGKYEDTYLGDVPYGIFCDFEDSLPLNWGKRARHYYNEIQRVKKGVKAWREGDLELFGNLIFESGRSSIELYETGTEELRVLQNIMENTEGIYGGRFSGAGFNGSSMALVNPDKKDDIRKNIVNKYLSIFPNLKDSFSVHFCRTADGVELR